MVRPEELLVEELDPPLFELYVEDELEEDKAKEAFSLSSSY